jgi:hypothetical protein
MAAVFMIGFMSEDEIGELKDELRVYKEQLDALRKDFRILLSCSPQTQSQITAAASQSGPGGEEYLKFAKDYGIPLE